MTCTGSEPQIDENRRLRKYMLNTRPGAEPEVLYSTYSPAPKSDRSSQKNDKKALFEIRTGNDVLPKFVAHAVPKNRLPLLDTVTCVVFAPKPLNVKPSGIAGRQVSSPSASMCVQPTRSSMLCCMFTDASIM